jgi:hypothetical protein
MSLFFFENNLILAVFLGGRAASRGLRPRLRRAIRSITCGALRACRWFRCYPSRKKKNDFLAYYFEEGLFISQSRRIFSPIKAKLVSKII